MQNRTGLEFDPQQVASFLEKIARDRDRTLQEIEAGKAARIAEIRAGAFAECRNIHRKASAQSRQSQQQMNERYSAVVKARLRRRRWRLMTETQQRLAEAIWLRMIEAWNDGDGQWRWCRYWITAARRASVAAPLQIRLGKGGSADVCDKVKAVMQDYPAQCEVLVDSGDEPGVVVRWPDHLLDGSLRSQYPLIRERALERVAQLIYAHRREQRR